MHTLTLDASAAPRLHLFRTPQSRLDAALAAQPADVAAVKAVLDSITEDTTPVATARAVLSCLVDELTAASNDTVESVVTYAVGRIGNPNARDRVALGGALDDLDLRLRLHLFSVLVADDANLEAAGLLTRARLDSPAIDDRARATALIKAAQAFNRADDEVAADRCLKKAADPVDRLGDPELRLQHRALNAMVRGGRREGVRRLYAVVRVYNT